MLKVGQLWSNRDGDFKKLILFVDYEKDKLLLYNIQPKLIKSVDFSIKSVEENMKKDKWFLIC